MKLDLETKKTGNFQHLELLANQVVEGFVSGMHKSPFHGFSAEFAEHKIYNTGESTRNIDWKLFAKTDRLYTKCFEEDTNLRCHIIIDNSSSMHYPELKKSQLFYENKIGFSVLASAVLMNLLKKQRDTVGLSVFSDYYEYYAPEKGSDRHHQMILSELEKLVEKSKHQKTSKITTFLHQIAKKIHRRSMIILFTDMLQINDPKEEEKLFGALQHLRHDKHKVVLFHVLNQKTEINLDFDNIPRKFIDIETGEEVSVFSENIKEEYGFLIKKYFKNLELTCNQNKIKYVPVSVNGDFNKIMTTYLSEKKYFV